MNSLIRYIRALGIARAGRVRRRPRGGSSCVGPIRIQARVDLEGVASRPVPPIKRPRPRPNRRLAQRPSSPSRSKLPPARRNRRDRAHPINTPPGPRARGRISNAAAASRPCPMFPATVAACVPDRTSRTRSRRRTPRCRSRSQKLGSPSPSSALSSSFSQTCASGPRCPSLAPSAAAGPPRRVRDVFLQNGHLRHGRRRREEELPEPFVVPAGCASVVGRRGPRPASNSISSNGFFSLMALRFLHGVLIPLQRLSVLHLCRNSVREHSLDHIH